eukprot:5655470-Amphidinium_carterae.1
MCIRDRGPCAQVKTWDPCRSSMRAQRVPSCVTYRQGRSAGRRATPSRSRMPRQRTSVGRNSLVGAVYHARASWFWKGVARAGAPRHAACGGAWSGE